MATCPMKNRHCEGVVTVDISSCVCMGVMGVYGCMGYGCLRESMGVYGFSNVN